LVSVKTLPPRGLSFFSASAGQTWKFSERATLDDITSKNYPNEDLGSTCVYNRGVAAIGWVVPAIQEQGLRSGEL